MKHILTVVAIATIALFSSCTTNKNLVEITGKVQVLEMSTFQYGTHTIQTKDAFYALKSEELNLTDFDAQTVTVIGEKVEGYPLSGGPELIEVKKVKK